MKNSFSFKLLYSFFLIAIIALGGIHLVGPLTTRHIALIIMLFTCIKESKSIYHNSLYAIHLFFVLIFGLCSFYHGFFDLFIHDLIAYYFTAYVCCWATTLLIVKFDSIGTFINTLLILAIFNGIVTIGQYFNNAIAWGFPVVLQVTGFEMIEELLINHANQETLDFAMPGLLGSVLNGYFSSVVAIIVLKYFRTKQKVLILGLWFFLMFSLFCVQQRTALVAGVLGSICLIIKQYKVFSQKQKFVFIVICIVVTFYLISLIDFDAIFSNSRYNDFSMDSRESIYKDCKDYIASNPLAPNIYHFNTIYENPPHNVFYNSIIFGTFLGAVVVLYVLFRLVVMAAAVIFKKINDNNVAYVTIAVSFLAYNVNSLAHNASIVTGDVLFWLLATPIMLFINKNPKKNEAHSLYN